ncbi:CCA tRNA nucleotidyltransferase [Haloferula rosea]|uniref:CCA tRNA nucleotidyltransferase n=1 Tax=Haloferula rosea TaxID=490093 RepID=A0A934RB29_9BACT|nr:CCA tRNA nucleotidyltransferase [Haloferula rosea]MBK1828419.1 CCA tRNA nucleotidyltransferase [Haloferula rosea]
MSKSSPVTPRSAANDLARRLRDSGFIAYLAGGCVRDALLGREPKDFDLATSATPAEVLKLFPGSNEVGAHFGVVIVKHGGHPTEVATFRTDGSYHDGRHPDSVTFSTPEDDAQRRDFTVNGLFLDPASDEVIDFVGGRSDLEARTLRAIGVPAQRFEEDALRLMRAVRFATSLDFQIETATWEAVQTLAPTLSKVSPERIRDEFSRILVSPQRARGLDLLVDSGLIAEFMPEVLATIGCEQPPQWHPEGDVYTHTRIMLDMLGEHAPLELCLAVLLHDIAKPPTQTVDEADGRIRFNGHDALGAEMAADILRRLRYPNQVIEDVSFMVSRHMQFMNVQQMRTAKLKRFMSSSTFEREMELHRVDCASSNGFTDNYDFLQQKEEEFANQPLIPEPLVTGRDLINLGMTPGPAFKEILQDAQTEQLEGRLATREDALAWLKQRLESQT